MPRVVLIDDHTAILEMMRNAVESLEQFTVVGAAREAAAAEALCGSLRPDIVILDLALGRSSGLELLPVLKAAWAGAKIIVFSGHLRVGAMRRLLTAGAHGLLEKTATLAEFHDALVTVATGKVYFSRFASEEIRQLVQRRAGDRTGMVRLSARERQLLGALAEGMSSKEIAAQLGITRPAVGNLRARLMKKTGLRGTAQLARYAVSLGLASEEVPGAPEPI